MMRPFDKVEKHRKAKKKKKIPRRHPMPHRTLARMLLYFLLREGVRGVWKHRQMDAASSGASSIVVVLYSAFDDVFTPVFRLNRVGA